MPWSHLSAWAEAASSDKLYMIVRGTLLFDERELPRVDWQNQQDTPAMTRIDGYIEGLQLSPRGFIRPFQSGVTLEVACMGPWCADLISGVEYIAFVENRDGEMVISTNPCGGNAFGNPTEQMAEDLTRCMRGGACQPDF